MDHDQRFKNLIREFFSELMQLFFEDWAARLELDQKEWIDTEVFSDPPAGSRHILDLVARLPVLPSEESEQDEASIVLVHIEIESPDRTTQLKPRLPYYYHFLRDTFRLPVIPLVVYLNVGTSGDRHG